MKTMTVIRMETNYRCDKSICDAAQRLIDHNRDRIKKGMVSASLCEGEISATQYATADEEKKAVLDRIRTLPGTHAVLLRTNYLVDEMTNCLESEGVPLARMGIVKRPTDWKYAKICVGLLNDPSNDWFAYWFIRHHNDENTANIARLSALAAGKSLNEMSLNIERDVRPDAYKPILERMRVSDESISIIEATIAALEPGASGSDLLERLSIDENLAQETPGTFVGTVHSAKGREFHNVHLCAAEEEIMPGTAKSRDIEEERRIAFVAMTRARERLFISCCLERVSAFSAGTHIPSRFIRESGIPLACSVKEIANIGDDIPM